MMNLSLRSTLVAALAAAALLPGCAELAPAQYSQTRQYAIDQSGFAKSCTAPKDLKLTAGQTTPAAISVGNDGGWCAISVAQSGPSPYAAGLLRKGAEHGTVYIHAVGDFTRIDYTPDRGYTGPDSYQVAFLPGQPTLDVTVSVTPAGVAKPGV
jgi:hypothetical protein